MSTRLPRVKEEEAEKNMSALALVSGYDSESDEEEKEVEKAIEIKKKDEEKEKNAPEVTTRDRNGLDVDDLFANMPSPSRKAEKDRKNTKKKSKKKKKHKQRKQKADENEIGVGIPILSLQNEKNIAEAVELKKVELHKRLIDKQRLSNSGSTPLGPQLPRINNEFTVESENKGLVALQNSENQTSRAGDNNFDPRHIERDVRNFIEEGVDLSKLSDSNMFATVDGTKIKSYAKQASELSDKDGTKSDKLSVGFISNNTYKRRHNITGLLSDAESFESVLYERRSKSAKSISKVRNMYGF